MLTNAQYESSQEIREKQINKKELDKTSFDKPKSPRSVRRVAMDCLARREHSFFELKQKLQIKLPDKSSIEIQCELEKLREQNLQSDKRFAEAFVRYRKSKGFGYLHIREDLRRRFVSEALIEENLNENDLVWHEMVFALVIKRLPPNQKMAYGSFEHRKIERFLKSRGFQNHQTKSVLADFIE